jgi:hypothetical protein
MAKMAVSPRKRLAMGHEPRSDPRTGGMVVPRAGGKSIKSPKTKVGGSEKPTLESRAGVKHSGTDKGERYKGD